MLRFLVRVVGFFVFAAGFAALVIDGAKSIAASGLVLTKLGETGYALVPDALGRLQAALERAGAHDLWDPVALAILTVPTFAAAMGIGVVLMILGAKRLPPIGYSSRP